MILSSLLGQSLTKIEREAGDSLDPCLFRHCSVTIHLSRCNLSKPCIDLLDLRFEGFHGTLDGFNGPVFLKKIPNRFSLSLNIGFPLMDSLM